MNPGSPQYTAMCHSAGWVSYGFSNCAETTCSIAIAVILSAAKDLSTLADEILRCAQDDSRRLIADSSSAPFQSVKT